ncbi:hypothetical protein FISHEDRAFT_76073 [Fistulina hepatica ATCC 64428]|uniref:Protein kinase domain-containing protein n=1 Tax=Fistulina hepatica ATCC 64428 TaxID=1128425 RepID=A0A0D7A4U8_9AGAR|nr:hypothetical protein FISHEDRAFT_76073 [Fistulina hepatica ATCC 64428]
MSLPPDFDLGWDYRDIKPTPEERGPIPEDKFPPGDRQPWEERWVELHPFLTSLGYKVRPRYCPDWIPSWDEGDDLSNVEDAIVLPSPSCLDGIRIKDDQPVVFKRTTKEEAQLTKRLSDMRGAHNHTVPVFDILQLPDSEDWLIIMDRIRRADDPPFAKVGEVYQFVMQAVAGLKFMHRLNVAHRNITMYNMLFNGRRIIPFESWHFVRPWTVDGAHELKEVYFRFKSDPVIYYYCDFHTAVSFPSNSKRRRVPCYKGQHHIPPEAEANLDKPIDPFKADVWQLGAMMRQSLLDVYTDIEWLAPFADMLCNPDPDKRPTATKAYDRIVELVTQYSKQKLRDIDVVGYTGCYTRGTRVGDVFTPKIERVPRPPKNI